MTTERLQKVLARGGIASRRHAEELITAGRVRVNGRVVSELGAKVDPRMDKVEVDGRRVVAEPLVYYLLHKPRGAVTTLHDPEGRATIAEYLRGIDARVFPVGRLDFHTSGALLLTNDGMLSQALLHPRRAVPKVYVAKVKGEPTDVQLQRMRNGVQLEPVEGETGPVKTAPAEVEVLRYTTDPSTEEDVPDDVRTTWLRITLREGRNRQIHRMAEAVGLLVMRLARLSFAGIDTDRLRPGEVRPLTDKELTLLRSTYQRALEQSNQARARNESSDDEPVEPAPARKPFAPRTRTDDRSPSPRSPSSRSPSSRSGSSQGDTRNGPSRANTSSSTSRTGAPRSSAPSRGGRSAEGPRERSTNRGGRKR